MVFSSCTFLFLFLPAVLGIYACVDAKYRNFVLLAASLLSYMLGDWINDIVFREMKKADRAGNRFAARSLVSSFCGNLTDSMIFIPFAFIGTMPFAQMCAMVLTQAGTKLVLEFILLPLTKWCVAAARRRELSRTAAVTD